MRPVVLLFFLVFLILFCTRIIAQNNDKGKTTKDTTNKNSPILKELDDKKKLKIANQLYAQGSFYNAIDLYYDVWSNNYVWKKDSSHYNITYRLALTYFYSRDYKNSERFFGKVLDIKPKEPNLAKFFYGESLRYNGRYQKAKQQFMGFRRVKYAETDARYYKKIISSLVKSCDYAIINMNFPVFFEIKNIGEIVNSAYTDFSPMVTKDSSLIFASLKSDTILLIKYGSTEFYPVKLYQTKKNDTAWSEPEELTVFNKDYTHNANPALPPDSNIIFFTRCKPISGKNIRCAIYVSRLVDGKWQEPEKLGKEINKSKYTSTQPTLGKYIKKKRRKKTEHLVLYFVSDRLDRTSRGGLDIWYSEIDEKNKFTRPKNLGKRINTIGDEITPFYQQKNKTLYFSSNYHHGFGGFDMFQSHGSTKRWTKPENMGYKLNSSLDDTYYITDSEQKQGYFVSNRPGGRVFLNETCCDDIYTYDFDKLLPVVLTGIIYDKDDTLKTPLTDVGISLYQEKIKFNKIQGDTVLMLISGTDTVFLKMAAHHPKKDVDTNQTANNNITFSHEITTVSIIGNYEIEKNAPNPNYYFTVIPYEVYNIRVDKIGFESKDKIFNVFKVTMPDTFVMDIPISIPKIFADLDLTANLLDSLKKDSVSKDFVLKTVYHGFDEEMYEEFSEDTLNEMLKILLKYPSLKFEVISHTDSRGSDAYNMFLSIRRAENVKNYFMDHGVDEDRLIAIGMGETRLISPDLNPDGTDNSEGRKRNRRTVFRIYLD